MRSLTLLTALMLATLVSASAAEKDARIYVLSPMYAQPGKLDELHAVVRDRFIPQAAKHGVTLLGAFTPLENPDGMILLVGSRANAEAIENAGKTPKEDPEFAATLKTLEGLTDKTKAASDRRVQTTDFSPEVKVAAGQPGRVFELRTYTTTPGNLPLLHARFRDHTIALFAKYGMTNLWYWQLIKDQSGADNTLIYLLAHASTDAAKASFDGFRKDPEWTAARKASEEKGGGSLTVPDGVKSLFLQPTDYSPLK